MNKLILFAFAFCILGCKKDSVSPGSRIVSVTVNGKTHQTFEYDVKGRLLWEKEYFSCTTTPMNEYIYTYEDNRLLKVNSTVRTYYSSVVCDPAKGFSTEEFIGYDNSGKIIKVVRPAGTTDYVYNQQGLVFKKLLGGGINKLYEYYYDSRGNVIKEIDAVGHVTEFEFDSSPNPFYEHRSNVGTPFTMSPNNIIKGKGANNFVRKFEYKSNMPVKVVEDNGQTYEYHYQ